MRCNICGYDLKKYDTDRTRDPNGKRVHLTCLRDKLQNRKRTLQLLNQEDKAC